MNIDKAIEISEKERKDHHSFSPDIIGQAAALGIEALKREKEHRELDIDTRFGLLPGETIE